MPCFHCLRMSWICWRRTGRSLRKRDHSDCIGRRSVAVCRDKYGFFSLLQKNGLPVLYTSASLEEFDSDYAEGKIAFPVFVKPVRGCGSVGISRVDNRELLGVLCRYSKEPLLIQQYADGEEFGADIYVDLISKNL